MSHVTDLRLTDSALDFSVDVRLPRLNRRWLAVADLAGTPDDGMSTDPNLAVLFSLWSLGPDLAGRMTTQQFVVSSDQEQSVSDE